MKHVEAMWSNSMLINKTLITVPFFNPVHYPDLSDSPISICDMFILPTNIVCLNVTSMLYKTELMLKYQCKFYGPRADQLKAGTYKKVPSVISVYDITLPAYLYMLCGGTYS